VAKSHPLPNTPARVATIAKPRPNKEMTLLFIISFISAESWEFTLSILMFPSFAYFSRELGVLCRELAVQQIAKIDGEINTTVQYHAIRRRLEFRLPARVPK
jgi:hypothetical protein